MDFGECVFDFDIIDVAERSPLSCFEQREQRSLGRFPIEIENQIRLLITYGLSIFILSIKIAMQLSLSLL